MRLLITALAATALLVTGCGGAEEADRPSGPTTLQPAPTTGPASGTQRLVCPITTDDGQIRVQVDLPEGFRDNGRGDALGCVYSRPLGFEPGAPGRPTTVSLSLIDDGDDGLSVRQIYDEQEPDAVEDDEFNGDETTYDLVLTEDEPTFGPTIGDRVSWQCYCDGAPEINYVVQADGIELSWTSVPDITTQTERELDAALASTGLAP